MERKIFITICIAVLAMLLAADCTRPEAIADYEVRPYTAGSDSDLTEAGLAQAGLPSAPLGGVNLTGIHLWDGDGGKDFAATPGERDQVYTPRTSTTLAPITDSMTWLPIVYGRGGRRQIMWQKTIMNTTGLRVSVDVEQNAYFLGASGKASYVVKKHDPEGNEIWSLPILFEGDPDYVLFEDMAIDEHRNVYILVNYSNDYFLLRKYRADRTLLWEIQLQPTASILTVAAVCVNEDDDILLAGRSYLTQLNRGVWISELDASGTQKWEKTFDYGEWHDIRVTDMAIDQDGNIYIVGHEGLTISDIFIAKFDQNGNVIWDKRTGSANHDEGWCIATDYENNVIVHGYINKPWVGYENSGWLGKFSSNGDEVFSKTTYDGNQWGITFPTGLAVDNENSIYISGYGGEAEGFVSKYDEAGSIQWTFSRDQWYDCPDDIALSAFNEVYFVGDLAYRDMIYGKIGPG